MITRHPTPDGKPGPAARPHSATAPQSAQPAHTTPVPGSGPARPTQRTDGPTQAAGALRVHPLPYEATASYLQRLAQAHQLTLPQLLDGLDITTNPRAHGTPDTAELHLDHTARQRLTLFTRTPEHALARALPRLGETPTRSPDNGEGTDRTATPPSSTPRALAVWQPLQAGDQPVRACPACTLRRTHGTTSHALIHPPPHQVLCPLHQHWSLDPHRSLHTGALPELTTAHHHHRRLQRHPGAATATAWATAITTRWYDQQTLLAHRWQRRLKRIADTNPHATPTGRSWALYARPLITYPETITLARTLARTRLPDQPRQGPSPTLHPAITAFLHHTAHQLQLPRLAPPPADLLWTWIHHHNHPS